MAMGEYSKILLMFVENNVVSIEDDLTTFINFVEEARGQIQGCGHEDVRVDP